MQNPRKTTANASKAVVPVLLACSFAASFSESMMSISLPKLADEFSLTLSVANWVVVGYLVVAATSVTLAAFLLKRFGLRVVFFLGGGALALGSGLAMLAPSFPALFVCRLLQAVCTGLFFPTVTGVIMIVIPKESLGVHLAMNSGIIALGLAISPVASGFMLTYFGWRAMFFVPFVLAAVLLVAGFFLLHDVEPRKQVSADFTSAAFSLLGLGSLVYGLSEITHDLAPAACALGAAAVILTLFVHRQLASKAPLLNLRPFGHPRFTIGLLLVMVGMMISFSLSVLLPLYFEGALGHTAFFAGLLLLAPVLVNAICALAGGRLFDKRGAWPLLPLGFALSLAGLAGVCFFGETMQTGLVVAFCAVAYAGLGFATTPAKTTALDQLPPELYSHGAAINSTFVQIGSAIGPSLFVGVLSSDVLRGTAAGLSKADAYAAGFSHTLAIAIGIAAVGLVAAILFAYTLRRKA
ncbi:MFS transporter [Raoultibacter massiliensis]|uniref:MFS transporter n=1 Tax=Raoultibacter massiliensis TaxID=1852371 RepID=A0ABV1JB33_9ACTN|nr:MFS transporter [Raoultibacter massiliensis]